MSLRDLADEMKTRRERILAEMGGRERIERQHARGRLTIRERIDRLLDPGSFVEIGTFSRSERPEAAEYSPGDGKIAGLGTVGGRPVAVSGDDMTVFHGSSSVVGGRRNRRLYDLAIEKGFPFIYLGETGGARLPDSLGSEGFSKIYAQVEVAQRARQVPMATAILGESFGGSSFQSALSDFVVQVRGTCLAVTSPRVVEVATGEQVGFEELGGVDVHLRRTGQIDAAAGDEDGAFVLIRAFLSYLPSNCWSAPPRADWDGSLAPDERLYDLVPTQRTRGYDMRRVIRRLVDRGAMLELKPEFGRSLVTCLARIGGRTVGIVASNPMFQAGALDPNACDKATQFLCLCDAFNVPLIFLQDVPGFIVGKQAEHDRLLAKAIMFLEALAQSTVPKVTVVLRKAFGLAYYSLCGNNMGGDLVLAWPSAEISFMDPAVGVNVVYADKLRAHPEPERERERLIAEWSEDTTPYGAAGIMALDEIIDPAETRPFLIRALERLEVPPPPRGHRKPLQSWPTCL
jgi:acetyl-CoA carboxylase carboxyltransferase component